MLAGTIDFADPAHPIITAWAASPGANIDIPIINISEVGIKLRSDETDIFSLDEVAINSVADVYANISFGVSVPIAAEITTPLLQGNFIWPLTAVFSEPVTAATGFALILDFFGQPPGNLYLFPFPLVDSLLRNFGVKALGVGIQPPLDGQELALKHASIALTSVETWKPSLAFITVRELGTAWMFHWAGADNWVTGNVWGKLTFFDDPALNVPALDDVCTSNKIELAVRATLPDWIIDARNESDDLRSPRRGAEEVLRRQRRHPRRPSHHEHLPLRPLRRSRPTRHRLMVEGLWATQINRVTFSLDKSSARSMSPRTASTEASRLFVGLAVNTNGVETTKATFIISAEYRRTASGVFQGGLAEESFHCSTSPWPSWISAFLRAARSALTELQLTYENSTATSTDNPYSARGALEVRWKPEVLGLTLSAAASASCRASRRRKTRPTA